MITKYKKIFAAALLSASSLYTTHALADDNGPVSPLEIVDDIITLHHIMSKKDWQPRDIIEPIQELVFDITELGVQTFSPQYSYPVRAVISVIKDIIDDPKDLVDEMQQLKVEKIIAALNESSDDIKTFFDNFAKNFESPVKIANIITNIEQKKNNLHDSVMYIAQLGGVNVTPLEEKWQEWQVFVSRHKIIQDELAQLKIAVDSSIDSMQQSINAEIKKYPEVVENFKKVVQLIKDFSVSDNPMIAKILKEYNDSVTQKYLTDASTATNLDQIAPAQYPDNTVQTLAKIIHVTMNAINNIVDGRMNDLSSSSAVAQNNGIAAGDLFSNYGLWVKALVSNAKQKEYGVVPGYKINQSGITLGVDIGEESIYGVAFSYIQGTTKGKGHIQNKDNVKNYVGTIYSLYNFGNNIFINVQGQYGASKVNKSRITSGFGNNIAHGKTSGSVMGARLELGYNYSPSYDPNLHLVPLIGISYDSLHLKAYDEDEGTPEVLNRSIGKMSVSRTMGLVGVVVSYNITTPEYNILPQVHAKVNHALRDKADDTKITLIKGMDAIVTPTKRSTKTTYTFGSSIKFSKQKSFDFVLGYDCSISKKFIANSGYTSIKINL